MRSSRAFPTATARIDGYSWLPKITNVLLGLIIFFSATQLGLHFWPPSTLVYGIRIDYLAPTIYFLDLLIILYLSLQFRSLRDFRRVIGTSVPLLPILLVNLLFSQNPLATLSWSLHLILYLMFIFSTTIYDLRATISKILPLVMFFEVLLGSIEVVLGHSIGGWLYWVGERIVAVGSPGIATATFMGHVVLRAYATFGHPNVLAGWLVICLLILLRFKSKKLLLIPATAITIVGVLLTQSRAAALALFGLVIPFYFIKSVKSRLLYISIFFCSLFFVLPTGALTRGSDLSLTDRLNLQGVSWQAITHYPIFGTGTASSISTYPALAPNFRLLQPDHDSLTLFLSWFGLFGTLAIFSLLRPFNIRYSLFFILPLLPILLLDHYLLTSPQGLFILLLYLRCCEK